MAAGETQVLVGVVSWNTRDLLRRCLESLALDVQDGLARVRVVDNASEDGSPDLVHDEFPWAELVESGGNIGFGRAANLALADGAEPWVAPSNADVALEPGALRTLVDVGNTTGAGLLAPRLITPTGETQHSVHAFPGVGLGLAVHSGLGALIPPLGDRLCLEGRWDPERERPIPWAHGAFLVARRDAYERVGGFDPGQWMYAEDIDLCWRLKRAGRERRYVPAARVHHEVSAATTKAFAETRVERHLQAAYDWTVRRRGVPTAKAYAAINWAGAGLRALALWPRARARGGRWAVARDRLRMYSRLYGRWLGGGGLREDATPSATVRGR